MNTVENNVLINEINKHYSLPQLTDLNLFSDGLNTHYLIQTSKNKLILRVYKPKFYATIKTYELELHFLDYLKKNGINVSFPIVNKNGKLLHKFTNSDQEELMAIFSFAQGESVSPPSIDQAFIYGKELAKLHLLGQKYPLTDELPNKGRDYLSKYQKEVLESISASENLNSYFNIALERFETILNSKSKNNFQQGVIWGDAHFGNTNFDKQGNLTFYDFDTLGTGYLLFDIATGFCSMLTHMPHNFKELQNSLIKGYETVIQLNKVEKESFDLFISLRCLENFSFEVQYLRSTGLNNVDQTFFDKYENYIFNKIEAYQ